MGKDMIRYDLMVQDALKGVLRKLLADAARDGLPGEHHFFITFRTGSAGVRLSQRMREKYPDEMTIVLQHQFWDLGVTDHSFEVGLSFGGVPERLLVPFDAITGFFDPSVQFGLKFEQHEVANEEDEVAGDNEPMPATRTLRSVPAAGDDAPDDAAPPARPASGKGARGKAADKAHEKAHDKASESKAGAKSPAVKEAKDSEPAAPGEKPAATAPAAQDGGAQVVSLDAFRKKT
jgi:hypothetical protein